MAIQIRKIAKDHYVATYRKVVGEGKGPLSAVHDLFAKIHDRNLVMVETIVPASQNKNAETS